MAGIVLLLLLAHWPPAVAAQEATPVPAEISIETVLSAVYEAAPPAPAFVGLARFTLPPRAGIGGGSIDGPRVYLVEAGTIAFDLVEAASVLRGGDDGTPVAEPAAVGHGVVLRPGDALIAQVVPPLEIRNSGEGVAIFLDLAIWPGVGGAIKPFTSEEGVIFEPLTIGIAESMPAAPITVTLERLTLPPNGVRVLAPGPGPRLIYIESGRLGLGVVSGTVSYMSAAFSSPGAVPGAARQLSPGRRTLLTAGGSVMLQAGSESRIENLGRTRLNVLSLIVRPVQA